VSSDNPSGAGNQQERPGIEQWAVGFVDGEGCFSISVVRNAVCRLGWQVQHEFSVTQAATSRSALELLIEVFGCGRLIENRRHDDHRQPLLRFSVKRRRELVDVVVPFFEERPLRTAKRSDFEAFASVLRRMETREHLTEVGLREIASLTEAMNRRQRSRYLESSEAIRRPSRPPTAR
jgi:hypothetical protein